MMTGKITEIDQEQFDEIVGENKRVVVDFYSTECPPCEALASKYDGLSTIYGDDITFVKVFRQGNKALAGKLGVTSSPTLLFYEDGRLKDVRLSGGVKRSAIAQQLDGMLDADTARELKNRNKPVDTTCDVMILGGGPAGLTAGIYLAQAKVHTIVVDTALPGGYVASTHTVSNYPGFIEPQNGYMLSHFISEQAKHNGVDFRSAVDVSEIDLEKKELLVDGYERIHAKKIILATGTRPRALGIPGEIEYRGQGISYCATCDGKYFEGKDIVVIGGGNSAVEESIFLAKFANKITMVHQFDKLQANKLAQEKLASLDNVEFLFSHEPREFVKNAHMYMSVEVEDLKTGERKKLETNGVFIFAGFEPNLGMVREGFAKDKYGFITTGENMETDIEGVYAIGDLRSKSYRQITTAVADGTIAAIDITGKV